MKSFIYSLLFLISTSLFAQVDNVGSGRAISFDGVDDYIDLGNIYDNVTLPITVSFWVYIDASVVTGLSVFASQDNQDIYNGFWFSIATTAILMEYGDGTGSNNPAFRRGKTALINMKTNQWNHVCGVIQSSSNMQLYLNGIDVGGNISGSSALPMNSNFPADVAKIGSHFSNGLTGRFKGVLDEMRIYNVALTQAQIRQTMCKKITSSEPGLIGYWDFDETSGNTLLDKSSNNFNGTLMGNPTRIFSGAPIGNESVSLYPANWTGNSINMTEAGETITVNAVTPGAHGVQIYTVRNTPSQTTGLNVTQSTPPYFGVFVASTTTTGQTFDVTYSTGQCVKTRVDNSISNWSNLALEDVINRTEFIRTPSSGNLGVNLGNDETVCPFPNRVLQPVSNPAGLTFLWQNGSVQPTFSPTTYGTYWVNVTSSCLTDRDTITFTKAHSDLNFDLGDDYNVCPLPPTVLDPFGNSSGYTFEWQDGSSGSSLIVKNFGKYWLSVTGDCVSGSDTIWFNKPDFGDIFIPNIITPNDDTFNQYFVIGEKPPGPELTGATLDIYNRWGKKVYSANDYQNNWDGEGLPVGVYYYIVKDECMSAKKGWVSIVR